MGSSAFSPIMFLSLSLLIFGSDSLFSYNIFSYIPIFILPLIYHLLYISLF